MTKIEEIAKNINKKYATNATRIDFSKVSEYDSLRILNLRKKLNLSQRSFAFVLGVSLESVESWEQSISKPSRTCCRLMDVIERNPRSLDDFNFES